MLPATGDLVGRSVPEWRGKTADSPIPDDVATRVFLRYQGKCYVSGVRLVPGSWHMDHRTPLKDWIPTPEYPHGNVEHNLAPIWDKPHREKTAVENSDRAVIDRKRQKHIGLGKSKKKIQSRGFGTYQSNVKYLDWGAE